VSPETVPSTLRRVRTALALLAGALIAYLAAAVLGEYVVTLGTGLVAAVIVPLAVDETLTLVTRRRDRARQHLAAAVLGAAGIALGVWFSDGRGLQPWPGTGTVAVVAAALWPLARAVALQRRNGSVSSP
jgi:drug/metabolite transporter (DMT)-like permease